MYDPSKLLLLQRIGLFGSGILLVISMVAMMCSSSCQLTPELAEACAEANTYRYATCLPSLIPGGADCPGEKISWQIYDSLGVACWRYRVLDRTVTAPGCVTYDLLCLDSPGTLYNIDAASIPVWRHTDPVTGLDNQFDQHGYLPGQTFTLIGQVNDSTGTVLPVWWTIER